MKKTPELFKRTGKSSLTLRNFLNNLKENDIHYENKQITQCVFLGVLRLKPVPSIFTSSNVPSVSASVVDDQSRRIKNNNSNKEINKNVSMKTDMNKVISGKVRKKTSQKVKDLTKGVPSQQPNVIKIKLNSKTSSSYSETMLPTSSAFGRETLTFTQEDIAGNPTITLNPIIGPKMFNPVQNLFDKLKQKIDESYGEPGPSTVSRQADISSKWLEQNVSHSKVCKINATRQLKPTIISKELKKKLKKKSFTTLLKPVSPVTISDTETTEAKDKDDVILIGEPSTSNTMFISTESDLEQSLLEDIILINDEPKIVKERTSQRFKTFSSQEDTGEVLFRDIIFLNNEQQSLSEISDSNGNATNQEADKIIIISDEPRTACSVKNDQPEDFEGKNHETGNKVIIVDEVNDRISPSLIETNQGNRKSEEPIMGDEVIFINNEIIVQKTNEKPLDNSIVDRNTTQQHEQQLVSKNFLQSHKSDGKKTPEVNSATGVSAVINEKPKQKRNRFKSPAIPLILLNTPMLLRSEFAPKKPASTVVTKVRKSREKPGPKSEQTSKRKNFNAGNEATKVVDKNKSPKLLPSELCPAKRENLLQTTSVSQNNTTSNKEVVFISEESKNRSSIKSSKPVLPRQKISTKVESIIKNRLEPSGSLEKSDTSKNKMPQLMQNRVIDCTKEVIVNEKPAKTSKSLASKFLKPRFSQQTVPEILPKEDASVTSTLKEKPFNKNLKIDVRSAPEVVTIVKEEPKTKEKTSPMLLRSDLAQQKTSSNNREQVGGTAQSSEEAFTIPRLVAQQSHPENASGKKICANQENVWTPKELSRSEAVQPTPNKSNVSETSEVVSIKEETKPKEVTSPRMLRSVVTQQKSSGGHAEDVSISDKNLPPPRLLRSDVAQQKPNLPEKDGEEVTKIKTKEKSTGILQIGVVHKEADVDEVVEVKDETKPDKERVVEEEVIVKEEVRQKKSPRLLRSDVAQQKGIPSEVPIANDTTSLESEEKSPNSPNFDVELQKTEPNVSDVILVSDKIESKPRERNSVQQETGKKSPPGSVKEEVMVVPDEPITTRKRSPRLTRVEVPQKYNTQIGRKIENEQDIVVLGDDSETVPKEKLSPRSLRSDAAQKQSPGKKTRESGEKVEKNKNCSSPRLVKSEVAPQKSPRRGDGDDKKEKSPPKKTKSPTQPKLKTSMLLRSELAQRKTTGSLQNEEKQYTRMQKTRLSRYKYLRNSKQRAGKVKRQSKTAPKKEIEKNANRRGDLPGPARKKTSSRQKKDEKVGEVREKPTTIEVDQVKQETVEEIPLKRKKLKPKQKLDASASTPDDEKSPAGNRRKRASKKIPIKADEENKTPEKPNLVENVPRDGAAKKLDVTVFDFVETEPEVMPLRLSNSPKKDKNAKLTREQSNCGEGIAPKAKRPKLSIDKTDAPKTKVQAKAKSLSTIDDKSPQKNNAKAAPQAKSTKTKADNSQSWNETKSDAQSQPKPASPLKQATIMDMFSRAVLKKEKSSTADYVFESVKDSPSEESVKDKINNGTAVGDMPPPKLETKVAPPPDQQEENGFYDEDSDCDSRGEWIPEEYAEYKFKYSAKKMMSYKPIHKCKICLLILPSYYRLSKHKKEHAKKENPYVCQQCEEAFNNVEDLTAHLRIHKGKHPYTCKKCDIGFWSKKALDAHTPIHVLRKVKQPNKRFRCDVCAKEFSKLCDMERHTRVHTGEKPCVCNICNKRFQQSHNLSKHLLTHLHVKPYHCEICNKQFGRNDVLNRHLLTHSVDKPIKCALCSKGFIRQTQLNNHMKKNHPGAAKIETKSEPRNVETN